MEQPGGGLGAEVPGWLVEAITALARAQAQRMRGYFGHFHDIGEDDQVQVGVVGVLAALGGYDRRRGPIAGAGPDRLSKPFSTFATTVVKRRLIDLHRGRSRRAAQDVAIAVCADAVARGEAGEPAELAEEELAVWVRTIRVTAQRRAGDDPGRRAGRRRWTAAQEVACAALMWRRGLSCRGAALELADRAELRAALAMDGVPHFTWLARAAEVATHFPQKRPAANNGAFRGPLVASGVMVEALRRTGMKNLAQGALGELPALLSRSMILERVIPIGSSTLDRLVGAGQFPPPRIKVGRLRFWHKDAVERWLGAAPADAPKGE